MATVDVNTNTESEICSEILDEILRLIPDQSAEEDNKVIDVCHVVTDCLVSQSLSDFPGDPASDVKEEVGGSRVTLPFSPEKELKQCVQIQSISEAVCRFRNTEPENLSCINQDDDKDTDSSGRIELMADSVRLSITQCDERNEETANAGSSYQSTDQLRRVTSENTASLSLTHAPIMISQKVGYFTCESL